MKNILLFSMLAFGFGVYAQQSPVINQNYSFTMPVMPAGINVPLQHSSKAMTAINANLQYYAINYRKVFYADRFFDSDNADKFADFYDAYSYSYRNTTVYNIAPMIRNMPQPGPNLDYYNVDKNSGGLYDKVVTK